MVKRVTQPPKNKRDVFLLLPCVLVLVVLVVYINNLDFFYMVINSAINNLNVVVFKISNKRLFKRHTPPTSNYSGRRGLTLYPPSKQMPLSPFPEKTKGIILKVVEDLQNTRKNILTDFLYSAIFISDRRKVR